MKSFRWTLLFGVAVAGLLAFTVLDQRRAERDEQKKSEESKVIRFKTEDVQKVELKNSTGTYALEKKDKQWFLTAPVSDSADSQVIMGLLESIAGEKSSAVVAEGSELNLDRFGLDKPASSVKLTTATGDSQEVKVGSVQAFNSSVYARIGDEPRVYMVSSSWETQLAKPLRALRDKRPFRAKMKGDVTRVEIKQNKAKGPGAVLVLEKDDKGWKMSKGGDGFPISSGRVTGFVEQVKALRGLDIVSENQNDPKDAARFELKTPSLEIALSGVDAKDAFVLKVAEAAPDVASLAVASSDALPVFAVDRTAIDSLRKSPNDFYDRALPFRFVKAGGTKHEDVARIKVDAKTPTAFKGEFVKAGDAWKLVEGSTSRALQGEADSGKLNELVEKANRLEAVRISPPTPAGKVLAALANESKLELLKASGEALLVMRWGSAITEKGTEDTPEALIVPARTNLVDRTVGIPEGSLKNFSLDQLVQTKTKAK